MIYKTQQYKSKDKITTKWNQREHPNKIGFETMWSETVIFPCYDYDIFF
jgi:hypothetical protein